MPEAKAISYVRYYEAHVKKLSQLQQNKLERQSELKFLQKEHEDLKTEMNLIAANFMKSQNSNTANKQDNTSNAVNYIHEHYFIQNCAKNHRNTWIDSPCYNSTEFRAYWNAHDNNKEDACKKWQATPECQVNAEFIKSGYLAKETFVKDTFLPRLQRHTKRIEEQEHMIAKLENDIESIKNKWNLSSNIKFSENEIEELVKNNYSPHISNLLKEKSRIEKQVNSVNLVRVFEKQKKIEADFSYSPNQHKTTDTTSEIRTKNVLDHLQKNVFPLFHDTQSANSEHLINQAKTIIWDPWNKTEEYQAFADNWQNIRTEEQSIERKFNEACTINSINLSYMQSSMLLTGHDAETVFTEHTDPVLNENRKKRVIQQNEKINTKEPCKQLQEQYHQLMSKEKIYQNNRMEAPEYKLALQLSDSGYFSNLHKINDQFQKKQRLTEIEKDLHFWYSVYTQKDKNS
jgi:hypothetical protein